MKRILRNPRKFELMRIIDDFARSKGLDIRDPVTQTALVTELSRQLEENRKNDILHHGPRAQAMFAFVAGSLGACRLIKEEDAGELYLTDGDLRPPDFRIVTVGNQEFLVEVKNFHETRSEQPLTLARSYLA